MTLPSDLTGPEARALTDRIQAGVAELLPLIREAFERRADRALGYQSWSEYCDAELRGLRVPVQDRAEAVAQLRGAGMSTRAIGSALGVSEGTVRNDLSTAQDYAVEFPDRVTSLDGRDRPATRPVSPEFSAAVRDAVGEHQQRQSDRAELAALAEELGLKPDPAASAAESVRIALLYPFYDAVNKIASMPDPETVAAQIRSHERYHLDDLDSALDWLESFAKQWREPR